MKDVVFYEVGICFASCCVRRLELAGRVVVERLPGSRELHVRLDGDTVESLQRQLARAHAVLAQIRDLATHALGAVR